LWGGNLNLKNREIVSECYLSKKIVLQNGEKFTTPENQCPGWSPREQLEPNRKLFIDQLPSILHHTASLRLGFVMQLNW
jgi:hypothetical protein